MTEHTHIPSIMGATGKFLREKLQDLIYTFFKKIIYLFMAVLDLHFCEGFPLVA